MIHSRQLIFETQVTRADKNSENTKMDSHNRRRWDGWRGHGCLCGLSLPGAAAPKC